MWILIAIFQRSNLTNIIGEVTGIARCPYNPQHNTTSLITEQGDLYSATVMDFTARDPVVYRTLGPSPALRTAQLNSKWLNGRQLFCIHFNYEINSDCSFIIQFQYKFIAGIYCLNEASLLTDGTIYYIGIEVCISYIGHAYFVSWICLLMHV